MLTFCYDFDSIATSPCFLSQGVSIDVEYALNYGW